AGEPTLTRRFPYDAQKKARSYLRELRTTHPTVQLTQLEDNLLVRIRDKGYPEQTLKATSYDDAEQLVVQVLADRAQGRRLDYNRARKITLVQLFHRYIEEECPNHKGGSAEIYRLDSFLR